MATAHEYEEATNERVQNVRIGRKRNELQTCETYELRAPRRGSRQIVRANVRGRDQQAGRGKNFPYAPSMRNRPLVARIRVSAEQISTHSRSYPSGIGIDTNDTDP